MKEKQIFLGHSFIESINIFHLYLENGDWDKLTNSRNLKTSEDLRKKSIAFIRILLAFCVKYGWKSPHWMKSRKKKIKKIKEKKRVRLDPTGWPMRDLQYFQLKYLLPNSMSTVFVLILALYALILIFCLWLKRKTFYLIFIWFDFFVLVFHFDFSAYLWF